MPTAAAPGRATPFGRHAVQPIGLWHASEDKAPVTHKSVGSKNNDAQVACIGSCRAYGGRPWTGYTIWETCSSTRRPLQADRLRGGLFPLRGPLRPDRRLSRFWTLLRNLTGRRLTGRLLTGRPLTGRLLTGDTFNYRKAHGKLRRDLLPFKGPVPLTGALTGRPPDGKAPYGEASYEKAPYELQESLWEAMGRDFTRIGREFPLVRRKPKKVVFS